MTARPRLCARSDENARGAPLRAGDFARSPARSRDPSRLASSRPGLSLGQASRGVGHHKRDGRDGRSASASRGVRWTLASPGPSRRLAFAGNAVLVERRELSAARMGGEPMTVSSMLDCAGRRRSRATLPGFHAGRAPRNKGMLYPADPPTVEEIVCVMRHVRDDPHGVRLRAMIVMLWRGGLRIQEALALSEHDLDPERGSVLVRRGKGGRRREAGIDEWGWENLRPVALRAPPAPGRSAVLRDRRPHPRSPLVGRRGPHRVSPTPPRRASGDPSHPISCAMRTPSSSPARVSR